MQFRGQIRGKSPPKPREPQRGVAWASPDTHEHTASEAAEATAEWYHSCSSHFQHLEVLPGLIHAPRPAFVVYLLFGLSISAHIAQDQRPMAVKKQGRLRPSINAINLPISLRGTVLYVFDSRAWRPLGNGIPALNFAATLNKNRFARESRVAEEEPERWPQSHGSASRPRGRRPLG